MTGIAIEKCVLSSLPSCAFRHFHPCASLQLLFEPLGLIQGPQWVKTERASFCRAIYLICIPRVASSPRATAFPSLAKSHPCTVSVWTVFLPAPQNPTAASSSILLFALVIFLALLRTSIFARPPPHEKVGNIWHLAGGPLSMEPTYKESFWVSGAIPKPQDWPASWLLIIILSLPSTIQRAMTKDCNHIAYFVTFFRGCQTLFCHFLAFSCIAAGGSPGNTRGLPPPILS